MCTMSKKEFSNSTLNVIMKKHQDRHALKLGEIEVMVISDGVLSLPGAMLGITDR